MKYTKIPSDTFKTMGLNAGIFVEHFTPETGDASGIIGATSGGADFKATPSFTDFGEDIDNCPDDVKELKRLDGWDVSVTGTLLTVKAGSLQMLMAAADADSQNSGHLIPRSTLNLSDFKDLWWVGDYSDNNDGVNAGYIAIHLKNALSTGGFELKSSKKNKTQFPFTFTAHTTIANPDDVPYELYIQDGTGADAGIELNRHTLELDVDGTETLIATVAPVGATVTWSSADSTTATVSNGLVTGKAAGNTVITASITDSGVTYSDTCTVIVTD